MFGGLDEFAEDVDAVGVAEEGPFDGGVESLDALPAGLAVAGAGFWDDVGSGLAGDGGSVVLAAVVDDEDAGEAGALEGLDDGGDRFGFVSGGDNNFDIFKR